MSPTSNCSTMMATYVLDATHGDHNPRACIVEQDSRQMLEWWFAILPLCVQGNHSIREVLELEVLPLLQVTPHSVFHMVICWNMMGITASLAYTFTRNVARQTYLEYGWLATCLSWSSTTTLDALWTCIANCVEEDFPGTYQGPLWFIFKILRGPDCRALNLHIVPKVHDHRSYTVV